MHKIKNEHTCCIRQRLGSQVDYIDEKANSHTQDCVVMLWKPCVNQHFKCEVEEYPLVLRKCSNSSIQQKKTRGCGSGRKQALRLTNSEKGLKRQTRGLKTGRKRNSIVYKTSCASKRFATDRYVLIEDANYEASYVPQKMAATVAPAR